ELSQAGRGRFTQCTNAVVSEDTILVEEWNDIADGSDRCQCGRTEQKVSKAFLGLGAATDFSRELPCQLEADSRAAEFTEGVGRARQSRMNQRCGIGEPLRQFMMIGYDEFQADRARDLCFVNAVDSAVDGDHNVDTLLFQFAQRLGIKAV